MTKIIKPKNFLIRLKSQGITPAEIHPSDLLEVVELDMTLPFSEALDRSIFYQTLKKAVSDANSDAALSGHLPIDFDDLYTKYSEYLEALKIFVQEL